MARKKMTEKRRKQLKRIRQFIRRAENRGYRFPEGFKESLSTLSTQKLKSFTAEKLYKNVATAISEKTGKIVKGSERRAEERIEVAIKSAKTRKINKLYMGEVDPDWLKKVMDLQEPDSKDTDLLEGSLIDQPDETDTDWSEDSLLDEGRVVYENILNLIDSYPSKGSEELRKALNEEINTYGFDRVCASLALAPQQAIQAAQEIIYYPTGGTTSAEAHRAFIKLGDIIKGTVPSEQDARDIGDVLDEMGYGEE